jgi:hypothetical protein
MTRPARRPRGEAHRLAAGARRVRRGLRHRGREDERDRRCERRSDRGECSAVACATREDLAVRAELDKREAEMGPAAKAISD